VCPTACLDVVCHWCACCTVGTRCASSAMALTMSFHLDHSRSSPFVLTVLESSCLKRCRHIYLACLLPEVVAEMSSVLLFLLLVLSDCINSRRGVVSVAETLIFCVYVTIDMLAPGISVFQVSECDLCACARGSSKEVGSFQGLHLHRTVTPWSESASELYRPSDRRLSAK
jgi:hypothetical protein